jgi:hypothetical protein
LFYDNIMNTNPREILIQVALEYEGVSEIGGDNEGQQIEEFQRAVNGVASKEPWCMCFVQFCILKAVKLSGRLSRIYKSESVIETWMKSPRLMRRTEPEPGFIVMWQVGTKPIGHCGIVLSTLKEDQTFQTIEGNTGVGPQIERNGDGVYEKNRNRYPKGGSMSLLGFLDPFGG